MPIKIPDDLPARVTLEAEGVVVMRESAAVHQDIRPLRIGLLNLMPDKPRTETQFARLLAGTALQVELSLVQLTSHRPRNTPAQHMAAFYRTWEEVRAQKFDGFIITGAPVETLPFEEVLYWDELRRILDWTRTHAHACLTICWGAQAAVKHFHGVDKHVLEEKRWGVYRHRNLAPASPYLRGLSDEIEIPVSRWAEVRRGDLPADGALKVLLESEESGPALLEDAAHHALHMFDHLEYEATTLAAEYDRDAADRATPVPRNYFPADDPTQPPANRWRSHAHLFFANWLNEMYQTTPYELSEIGD
jgi:homoserine O-succinyltransferase/O-acetyltransferase